MRAILSVPIKDADLVRKLIANHDDEKLFEYINSNGKPVRKDQHVLVYFGSRKKI